MITHATLSAAVACEMDVLTNQAYGNVPLFQAGDAHISYLPLAHIYERAGLEAAIGIGAKVGFWQVNRDHPARITLQGNAYAATCSNLSNGYVIRTEPYTRCDVCRSPAPCTVAGYRRG